MSNRLEKLFRPLNDFEGKNDSMNDQLKYYSDKLAYEIDSWDLKVAIDAGEKITVVDTRSPESFHQGHLPGAVNLPHRKMSASTTCSLDMATLIICYCDGIGCNASTKGAMKLAQLGFRVKELIGGMDWWKRDGYEIHTKPSLETSNQCGCE